MIGLRGARALGFILVTLGLAGVALADTATIIGLIGKSVNRTRVIERDMDGARASAASFTDVRPAFEQALAGHVQVGRDLRTAFALGQVPPGYDPAARVPGMSAEAVRALPPDGFYFSAVSAHRLLNDRLRRVLEEHAGQVGMAEEAVYREQLNDAAGMVPYPRATDARAPQ